MRAPRSYRARSYCALLFPLLAATSLAHAQSGGPSITLQPVAPKTVPPSDYPPGTTIVGQEITLGSVPARVWFEIHVTGWASANLMTVHASLDYYAGLDGGNAECDGIPSGGAHLRTALAPCSAKSDCRATMSGITNNCNRGEPSSCSGGHCYPGFYDWCDDRWIGTDADYAASGDCCHGPGYAFSVSGMEGDFLQDLNPSYMGTWVIDVPAGAKGTYTIGFVEGDTYLLSGNPPPDWYIPIAAFNGAKITVPCGRCCYGVNTGSTGCVEGVSAVECATYAPSAVFQADLDCPDSGGPACPVCATDDHCDDGLYCNGPEVCKASGLCGPGDPPCESYEACEESTGSCAPRIPATNVWGMIALGMLLLIAAKLRYRRQPTPYLFLIIVALHFSYSTAAMAQGGLPGDGVLILQPVPPKTVPPTDYPKGTTINGQEILLGSVPARVWLEVQTTNLNASADVCVRAALAPKQACSLGINSAYSS